MKFNSYRDEKVLILERALEDADLLVKIDFKIAYMSEGRRISFIADGIFCIKENNFYIYMFEGMKKHSFSLLIMCEISRMENVIYLREVHKNKILFTIDDSQFQCIFASKKKWEQAKKIIGKGEEVNRVYKCSKVSKYLLENHMVDHRQIWCYAAATIVIKLYNEPIKLYSLVNMVCIQQNDFYLYSVDMNSKYDSTYALTYKCGLSEMEKVNVRKKALATVLSFSNGDQSFELEVNPNQWSRFSKVFESKLKC